MRLRSQNGIVSLSRSQPDDLATYLVREGHLQSGEVETILDHAASTGARFEQATVGLGYLQRDVVDQAIVDHRGGRVAASSPDRIDPTLVAAFSHDDPYLDHVRAIRSRLLKRQSMAMSRNIDSYALVGFDTGEDLAILAANLAIVLARSNRPTLLLSGSDGSAISAADLFECSPTVGGENEIRAAVAFPNLSVLQLPPATLRGDDRPLTAFARTWPVSDGQIIAAIEYDLRDSTATTASLLQAMTAIILVVRKHVTETTEVRAIIDAIDGYGIPIEGCVIV